MSNAIVSNVYRYVIDDVINQVRGDFEDMGIDDSILQELQRSWELKVARSRVANFEFKDGEYYDEEGELSNNNSNNIHNNVATAPPLAIPPMNINNIQQNQQQLLQQQQADGTSLQYASEYPNNMSSVASLASLAAGRQPQQGYGLPPIISQYQMMQPPLLNNNSNNNNSNNNNNNNNNSNNNNNNNNSNNQQQQQQSNQDPQLPGSTRPNLPQNDGSMDEPSTMTTQDIDQSIEDIIQSNQQSKEQDIDIQFTASSFSGKPLDLESLPESVQQLMKEAKERAMKAGVATTKSKRKARLDQLDGEEKPVAASSSTAEETASADDDINSDLDDSDDEDDDGEGGEEIEHIILCLYDKVTRAKNKWKCVLKDGIMLVNGRDYLFHRTNGDFEW